MIGDLNLCICIRFPRMSLPDIDFQIFVALPPLSAPENRDSYGPCTIVVLAARLLRVAELCPVADCSPYTIHQFHLLTRRIRWWLRYQSGRHTSWQRVAHNVRLHHSSVIHHLLQQPSQSRARWDARLKFVHLS